MKRRGNGEGSIIKRAGRPKPWVGVLDNGWKDGTRQRTFTPYCETREETQRELTKLLSRRDQGLPIAGERQTVEQYLTRWLESIKTNVRPRTLERFEQIVRLHLIPNIGRHRIEKLQPGHVQALLNQKLGSLSLQSVKHIRTTLGIALNQAVKWEMLSRNVAALTKLRPVETEEVKPLSADDARKLLNCATGHRLEALYSVAIAVGLRRGEALGLSWDDIDLDAETLRVNRSLQRVREGGKGELRLLQPKTQKSRRTIRLPDFAIKALRKHRARQAEERLLAGTEWIDNNLVFTTRTGGPLEP